MIEHSYWIVLLPLMSALTIFFFGRWLPIKGAALGLFAIGYSLAHSLALFFLVLSNPQTVIELSLPWFRFGMFQTELGIIVDGLSVIMLVVVTSVSFLVHIYSLGYMHNDPRFKRYYAYLSFFTFSMLLLVVANNFLQIFIGWELVGAASYLLIGFWFEKKSAASAGYKAFITTKSGDLGFFIAIMLIFTLFGTLNFAQVEGRVADGLVTPTMAGVIALLLFIGAMGKSAQVPLHIWLPDAMEGPTPVSALIHAATMVAAGIYMISRSYFIFKYGSFSLEIMAWIGGITALLAATMALVATDIKRVLAFSTVSQLGYMMLALGVGSRTSAMFHLTTHAFFKALLFLNAGSVIHAVHTNDIREMGGLSKKMIWTFWTFSFAWVAISGIWPFAGFFSKDAILEAAYMSGHHALFWMGLFTAFLTAFYMTRLYLLVFVTEERNIPVFSHAKESPSTMVVPLVVLAFFSLTGGFLFKYVWDIGILLDGTSISESLFSGVALHGEEGLHWFVPAVSLVSAVSGIILAFLFYLKKAYSAENVAVSCKSIYDLLIHKYYFDEFFVQFIIDPFKRISALASNFDQNIFDRYGVDGFGWFTVKVSVVNRWVDENIIDGLVDIWGILVQAWGALARKLQTGLAQNYIFFVAIGFGALLLWRLKLNYFDFIGLFF